MRQEHNCRNQAPGAQQHQPTLYIDHLQNYLGNLLIHDTRATVLRTPVFSTVCYVFQKNGQSIVYGLHVFLEFILADIVFEPMDLFISSINVEHSPLSLGVKEGRRPAPLANLPNFKCHSLDMDVLPTEEIEAMITASTDQIIVSELVCRNVVGLERWERRKEQRLFISFTYGKCLHVHRLPNHRRIYSMAVSGLD